MKFMDGDGWGIWMKPQEFQTQDEITLKRWRPVLHLFKCFIGSSFVQNEWFNCQSEFRSHLQRSCTFVNQIQCNSFVVCLDVFLFSHAFPHSNEFWRIYPPKTYGSETKRCKCKDLPKSPPHRYGHKIRKVATTLTIGCSTSPNSHSFFFFKIIFMLDSMVSGLVLGVRVVVETLPGAPATTPFKPPNLATFDQSLHGQDTQFLTAFDSSLVKEIHPWPGGPSKRTHLKKKHAPFSQIKSNFEWKKNLPPILFGKKIINTKCQILPGLQ